MSEVVELYEKPKANSMYMIAGWRQWADAGSTSSDLPQYLIQYTQARTIGTINPQGFYLFQFPGTHDLLRPVVKFVEGHPESLQTPHNELCYSEVDQRGLVFFLGDEPHLDIERYVAAFLDVARTLGVKRIIGLGGVYGEVPYNKERSITGSYSLPHMKEEMKRLAVSLSDYQGGASIGSYICKRAGEQGLEYVGLYAFVPAYNFTNVAQIESTLRIESDFMAWHGIMQRVNYMLKLNMDLSDLEQKSRQLVKVIDSKVEELDNTAPQIGIREYLRNVTESFSEITFNPLDEMWDEKLRQILDKFDSAEGEG
jgi:proteasome assembly chaperone (PAC2) family protein